MLSLIFNNFFSNARFGLPLIIAISHLLIAFKFSLRGPDGIVNPFPTG